MAASCWKPVLVRVKGTMPPVPVEVEVVAPLPPLPVDDAAVDDDADADALVALVDASSPEPHAAVATERDKKAVVSRSKKRARMRADRITCRGSRLVRHDCDPDAPAQRRV